MKYISVGIVGAGYISELHLNALEQIEGVNVIAIYDTSLERASSIAKRHNIQNIATSYDELLTQCGCDVIHILTPPHTHYQLAEIAIKNGVDVVTEKPVCINSTQAGKLLELSKRYNCYLGVCHNFLFLPAYEQMKQLLITGEIGHIDTLDIKWHLRMDQLWSGPIDQWIFEDPKNLLFEVGPHPIAFLLHLLPDARIEYVTTSGKLKFENGNTAYTRWHIVGQTDKSEFNISISLGEGFEQRIVEIRGTNGIARVDYGNNFITFRKQGRYGLPLGPLVETKDQIVQLSKQSVTNFGRQIKTANKLSPYGLSFVNCLSEYYKCLKNNRELDSRLSAKIGYNIVDFAEKVSIKSGFSDVHSNTRPKKPIFNTRKTDLADILVTGGTGFIGSYVVNHLVDNGARVRIFTRNAKLSDINTCQSVSYFEGSLKILSHLDSATQGIDSIYHLAQTHQKTWEEQILEDFNPTQMLCDLAVQKKIKRFIYSSSISALDTRGGLGPLSELDGIDENIHLRSLYSKINAKCEKFLRDCHTRLNLPLVIIRPGIVLGEGARPQHLGFGLWPSSTVCTFWGSGDYCLPVVLADDVARAMVTVNNLEQAVGECFNLVGDVPLTAQEYVNYCSTFSQVNFTGFSSNPYRYAFLEYTKFVLKSLSKQPNSNRPSLYEWQARTLKRDIKNDFSKRILNWHPERDKEKFLIEAIKKPIDKYFSINSSYSNEIPTNSHSTTTCIEF